MAVPSIPREPAPWRTRLIGWAITAVVILLLVRACLSVFRSNIELVLRREAGKPDEIEVKNTTSRDLSIIELSFNGCQEDCKLQNVKLGESMQQETVRAVLPVTLKSGSSVRWVVTCSIRRVGISTDQNFDEYAVDPRDGLLIINPDTGYHPGQKGSINGNSLN